jgi:hypothetical protein
MTEPQEPAAEPTGEVTAVPSSGDERVDAALGTLGGLAGRPVHEHVGVFREVHQRLQEVMEADQETEAG